MKKRGILVSFALFISFLFLVDTALAADRNAAIRWEPERAQYAYPQFNGADAELGDPMVVNDPWNVNTVRSAYTDAYPLPGPDLKQSVSPTNAGIWSRMNRMDDFVSVIQTRYKAFMGLYPYSYEFSLGRS